MIQTDVAGNTDRRSWAAPRYVVPAFPRHVKPPREVVLEGGSARGRLRTVEEAIEHLPVHRERPIPFPSILRLVLEGYCSHSCGVQGTCHREGAGVQSRGGGGGLPDSETVLLLRRALGLRKLKLIGVERTQGRNLVEVFRLIEGCGFEDLSATCFSSSVTPSTLDAMARGGLQRLTVSVHWHDRAVEEELDRLLWACRERGIALSKVNWVLTHENRGAVRGFLDWVSRRQVTARMFSLLWAHGVKGPAVAKRVDWVSLATEFAGRAESVSVQDYEIPCRRRYSFGLAGGGKVESSLPLVRLLPDLKVPAPCRGCEFRGCCEEGLLGCGIRLVGADQARPCLLRPDLGISPGHIETRADGTWTDLARTV